MPPGLDGSTDITRLISVDVIDYFTKEMLDWLTLYYEPGRAIAKEAQHYSLGSGPYLLFSLRSKCAPMNFTENWLLAKPVPFRFRDNRCASLEKYRRAIGKQVAISILRG